MEKELLSSRKLRYPNFPRDSPTCMLLGIRSNLSFCFHFKQIECNVPLVKVKFFNYLRITTMFQFFQPIHARGRGPFKHCVHNFNKRLFKFELQVELYTHNFKTYNDMGDEHMRRTKPPKEQAIILTTNKMGTYCNGTQNRATSCIIFQ